MQVICMKALRYDETFQEDVLARYTAFRTNPIDVDEVVVPAPLIRTPRKKRKKYSAGTDEEYDSIEEVQDTDDGDWSPSGSNKKPRRSKR